MASSSILPASFSWRASSYWISREGRTPSSSISIPGKAGAQSSISVSLKAYSIPISGKAVARSSISVSPKASSIPISGKAASRSSISVRRKASSIPISGKEAAADGTINLLGAPINAVSEVASSRISPWLMLPPAGGGDMVYNFYSFVENKVLSFSGGSGLANGDDAEVVGSSNGWLALFNKRNHDLFLYNPLSRRRIKLPSIHTLPLNDIRFPNNHTLVSKVIISCSPDDDECRAMIIFGPANRLAFCCPGRSTEWNPIGDLFASEEEEAFPTVKYGRVYCDFVYSSREKLFTCITDYDIEDWDLGDPHSPKQVDLMEEATFEEDSDSDTPRWGCDISDLIEGSCEKANYVVFGPNNQQLYLVDRYVIDQSLYLKNIKRLPVPVRVWDDSYPYKTIGFDVFKCDQEGRKLKYLEGSLGGLAMFVGTNHSFALSTAEFPELKPDSIYFTDVKEITPPDWHTYGAHDIGIYNFENRTFSPFYYPTASCDVQGIVPPPVWFTPTPH